MFAVLTGRLLDQMSNKECNSANGVTSRIGKNTEADDVLLAICTTLLSLFRNLYPFLVLFH